MTYIVVSRSPPDYFGESDQNLQSGLALAADIYIMGGRDEGDTGKQGTYKTFQKLYNFLQSPIDNLQSPDTIRADPQALGGLKNDDANPSYDYLA